MTIYMSPDRSLIFQANWIVKAHARWVAMVEAGHDKRGDVIALNEAIHRAARRLAGMKPATLAGFQAKARAGWVIVAAGDPDGIEIDDLSHLAYAVVHDLAQA